MKNVQKRSDEMVANYKMHLLAFFGRVHPNFIFFITFFEKNKFLKEKFTFGRRKKKIARVCPYFGEKKIFGGICVRLQYI